MTASKVKRPKLSKSFGRFNGSPPKRRG